MFKIIQISNFNNAKIHRAKFLNKFFEEKKDLLGTFPSIAIQTDLNKIEDLCG